MAKFPQRFRFDLTNALACDVKVLSDFLQRAVLTIGIRTKPQAYDLLFSWAQSLKNVSRNVTKVRRNNLFCWTNGGFIFDEISDLRFSAFANRRLKR